jgi:hypothetical protein
MADSSDATNKEDVTAFENDNEIGSRNGEIEKSIRVYLRVRPPSARELATGTASKSKCLTTHSNQPNSISFGNSNNPQTFTYDHVADEHSTQEVTTWYLADCLIRR